MRTLWSLNRIRTRLSEWRMASYPSVTRTTRSLLEWWRQPERRLFFAQLEAAETIIFLTEAPPDFWQGIRILPDEPSNEKKALGYTTRVSFLTPARWRQEQAI